MFFVKLETSYVLRYENGKYFQFNDKGDFGYTSWISSAEFYRNKEEAKTFLPAISRWAKQNVDLVKVNFVEESEGL